MCYEENLMEKHVAVTEGITRESIFPRGNKEIPYYTFYL